MGRRLSFKVAVDHLDQVPDLLFGLKVSQSKNPQRAGKLMFKYLSFQLDPTQPWSTLAFNDLTASTPHEEVKKVVVQAFTKNAPQADIRFTTNIPGKFESIETSEGRYSIYDFNVNANGDLGYYLNPTIPVTVTFEEAIHMGNSYLRISLSATDRTAKELFIRKGKAKIYGQEEEEAPSAAFTQVPDASDAGASAFPSPANPFAN